MFCHLRISVIWIFCSVFFFKQKTAYEMRISDWSSDVCSSDLLILVASGQAGERFWNCWLHPGLVHRQERAIRDRALEVLDFVDLTRSEERRVGKECVSTCRSRRSPYQ